VFTASVVRAAALAWDHGAKDLVHYFPFFFVFALRQGCFISPPGGSFSAWAKCPASQTGAAPTPPFSELAAIFFIVAFRFDKLVLHAEPFGELTEAVL
jgi:hypothetical protein